MNIYAIINMACNEFKLDEDAKRAMYVRVTGVSSLRAMSERQRIAVVEEVKRLGFKVRKAGKPFPTSTKPYVRLIHALWRSCYRKGVVRDGSRKALRSFVKNHATVDDPDFLNFEQATPVIEALKAMEKRA